MPKFAIGSVVTWVNSNGVKFPERTVVGIEQGANGAEPQYAIFPHDAPWTTIPESQLIADEDDPVIEVVGGHKIRNVATPWDKDEQWFLVGTTRLAFRTLDAAQQYAQNNPLQ